MASTRADRALGARDPFGRVRKIERPPNPWNPELLRNARHGIQYGRQQMRMFMRVEMSRPKAGIEDAPYLRSQFLVNADALQRHRQHQLRHSEGKRSRAHQHQAAADVELWIFAG